MYSNYITKWTELTSTYTRELDELNMAGDVYVIQPKNDPFKLNIAYEYVENPIEDVCEFIVHYTLRSAYEHIASVNTVPYTKYVRPILYKDAETVYLGLQCFDINKTLIDVPSIELTTDETDSVRIVSIQAESEHFLTYKEEVLGQDVKRNYQVETIVSNLEAEPAPIDVEKKWYLIYEYAYKYEQINPAVIEPQTFNEYTEENPYFVDGIVYQLPTSVYKYTKIQFGWGWDGGTSGYSIAIESSDKGVYHRPAIYREADGSPVFAIYTYDENFQFVEKKINSRGVSYKDKLIGFSQIRLYSPTAAYFDVYHYLPIGTRPELPNDHDEAAYRFTNHAKTQTKEPPVENMLELELKDYSGTPMKEEIDLPFYGIKDTWATTEVPYLRFAYSVDGGPEIQKYISGSSYVYNRYYKVSLVHYTTSAIYFIVYTYDDKGVQNSKQMLSIGVNGGFDKIRLRLLGIYSNACKVRNYQMKVKETFKIKNTFNTFKSIKGLVKNTFNTSSRVIQPVERAWELKWEYVGSSNYNLKNIMNEVVEPDLFIGYTESDPYFLDVALESVEFTSNPSGKLYVTYGFGGGAANRGTYIYTVNGAKYHRPAIYLDSEGCHVFAVYGYSVDGEFVDKNITTLDKYYKGQVLGVGGLQVYSPSGVYYNVYQNIPKNQVTEPVYINPKELLFTTEPSTQTNVPSEEFVLEKELKDYSGTLANEEIALPFYGIRRTTPDNYAYIRFEYSTDGGESVAQKAIYAYMTSKWYKTKLAMRCDKAGLLIFVFYAYDKNGELLESKTASSEVKATGGFDAITLRLLGFHNPNARTYNCKERVIERYPIEHNYATKTIKQRDYKTGFNTFSKIFAFEEVKKHFSTNMDIVQKISKAHSTKVKKFREEAKRFDLIREVKNIYISKYDTSSKIVKDSKAKFSTKLKVVQDSKIKYNTTRKAVSNIVVKQAYNTSSKVVQSVSIKHSTKINIIKDIKTLCDVVFSIGRDYKTIHPAVRNVFVGIIKKYDTARTIKYDSKVGYNTSRQLEATVQTKYNTSVKTEYNIKHKYSAKRDVKSTITRNFDTTRKIICKVNSKYNTETTVRFYVMARYNTQREIDIMALIKMLLGLTDSSKDNILRYLIVKAIEDMHAVCNLEIDELTKPKNSSPKTRSILEEGFNGYYTADSELGQNRHLQNILVDLVIYYFRMQGMEHLKNESIEGGSWNYIYESIPPQILARLKPYKRLPKLRVF